MGKTKYILITGGVSSSLGKGIISASLGKLLQARGYKVTIQKLEPYINIDSGMMNPYEHGECYVTVDGHESNMDLGHYERFLNERTTKKNNVTTGRIYQNVIDKERKGDYLGKTVQVVPHITNEIKKSITQLASGIETEFIISEIGGTVGDIETLPYIESVRQLRLELGDDCLCIHLTYVPYIAAAQELKTKPTQHSVKELLEEGVQPNVLVLRTEHKLNKDLKRKVALFCNVQPESVIEAIDVDSGYNVPLEMQKEGLDFIVLKKMGLDENALPDLSDWKTFVEKLETSSQKVRIGLVGKYVSHPEAYQSIIEALTHACAYNGCRLDLELFQSEDINAANVAEKLDGLSGILVAPGFGQRGVEGKIEAVKYARVNDIPFFGIGLGMQCAVIEFARNVLKIKDADSAEMNLLSQHKLFDLMESEKQKMGLKGTMRLGAYECQIKESTQAFRAYNKNKIIERHRHRFEFNNNYKADLERNGMICSGINPESGLVEIIELTSRKWFVGTQFHPEFESTALNPHPLFMSFIQTVKNG